MSRQAPRASAANGIVESGRASGGGAAARRPPSARNREPASAPARRAVPAPPRRRRPAARRGPATSEPTTTGTSWAARNVAPNDGHRDGREERRQRQPDLEGRPRERRGVASRSSRSRRRRGRGPRRGSGRRRRSTSCPPASGRRSSRRRRPGPPGPRRRRRRPRGPPRGGSRSRRARQRRAARCSARRWCRGRSGTSRGWGSRRPAPGRTNTGDADPARPRAAGEDRGERPDDVVALEDEPACVVRARDRLDRVDRVVRRDDPRPAGEVLEAGAVDRRGGDRPGRRRGCPSGRPARPAGARLALHVVRRASA